MRRKKCSSVKYSLSVLQRRKKYLHTEIFGLLYENGERIFDGGQICALRYRRYPKKTQKNHKVAKATAESITKGKKILTIKKNHMKNNKSKTILPF